MVEQAVLDLMETGAWTGVRPVAAEFSPP